MTPFLYSPIILLQDQLEEERKRKARVTVEWTTGNGVEWEQSLDNDPQKEDHVLIPEPVNMLP